MRIAIVTPSFQQGRFLKRTIDSVLMQNVTGLEYYVADGGSTDESTDILRGYDGRIRWVSEKDRGQAHAVNKAISETSAPVIGWLNSDDIYYPGALGAVLDYFDAHPETDVLYGHADHIGENGEVLNRYPTEAWDQQRLREICFLCQPAVFFRRSVVERWGLLDERLHYCMDYEYWLRLSQAGAAFALIERKLAGSRMYTSNKTMGSAVRVHAEINDMMKRVFGAVPDRWILNYAHAVARDRGEFTEQSAGFVWTLCAETWKAARRWNGRPSRGVTAKMLRWLTVQTASALWNGKIR